MPIGQATLLIIRHFRFILSNTIMSALLCSIFFAGLYVSGFIHWLRLMIVIFMRPDRVKCPLNPNVFLKIKSKFTEILKRTRKTFKM